MGFAFVAIREGRIVIRAWLVTLVVLARWARAMASAKLNVVAWVLVVFQSYP